jgi:hypothetical protein
VKFLPGLVVAVLMVLAIVWSRSCGQTEDAPPREFTELELDAADAEATGTCYSLSTVLIANTYSGPRPVITWTKVSDSVWKRRGEGLNDANSGVQGAWWIEHTFERRDDRVILTDYESSDAREYTAQQVIDALLEAPIERRSTKVDRCINGGTGYKPG